MPAKCLEKQNGLVILMDMGCFLVAPYGGRSQRICRICPGNGPFWGFSQKFFICYGCEKLPIEYGKHFYNSPAVGLIFSQIVALYTCLINIYLFVLYHFPFVYFKINRYPFFTSHHFSATTAATLYNFTSFCNKNRMLCMFKEKNGNLLFTVKRHQASS